MRDRNLALMENIVGADNIDNNGVIYPNSLDELVGIVKLANQENIIIYPIGQGTKFYNNFSPLDQGVVVSLKRFNKIIEYHPENMSIEVEAGLTTGKLLEKITPDGISYPIDIDNMDSTIGGQVAADVYGRKKYLYKSTRFYVLGLEFVSPQGEIIQVGGRTVKNASGYDISQMIAGSWGTFGIITKVILLLRPLPEKNLVLKIQFNDFMQFSDAASEILNKKLNLASLSWEYKEKYLLYIELEGYKVTLDEHFQKLKEKYEYIEEAELPQSKELKAKIAVSINNYAKLLAEIKKLTGIIAFEGNITNGIVHLDLQDEKIPSVKAIVEKLQGTLVINKKVISARKKAQGYLTLLQSIKKQVDPGDILFPEIIAKGADLL